MTTELDEVYENLVKDSKVKILMGDDPSLKLEYISTGIESL